MTKYIVQTAAETMPGGCWGRYCRVAVLEVDEGIDRASMISPRARGVRRVVATWERCHVGRTSRCASERALAAARELAASLNAAAAAAA